MNILPLINLLSPMLTQAPETVQWVLAALTKRRAPTVSAIIATPAFVQLLKTPQFAALLKDTTVVNLLERLLDHDIDADGDVGLSNEARGA